MAGSASQYRWSSAPAGEMVLTLTGSWSEGEGFPAWRGWCREARIALRGRVASVRIDLAGIEVWETPLLAYLSAVLQVAGGRQLPVLGEEDWPEEIRRAMAHAVPEEGLHDEPTASPEPFFRRFTAALGRWTIERVSDARETLAFGGEILLTIPYTLRRIFGLRGLELLRAMRQCGADAVPIVGLISFLTGLILAFQAALVLREYGADIFVANLIGLSMLREMGALMTAIVLAGRTGAAYAAHLGNMKVTEEMDAFKVTGLSAVEFLVVPRVLAMLIMMPLLVLYANALGILGGATVAALELDVTWSGYFLQLQSAVSVMDAVTGLIKSVVFALIIALTGCWRGLQCEGGSVAVGRATTSAVVTTIFLIIIADALFAVIFSILGW